MNLIEYALVINVPSARNRKYLMLKSKFDKISNEEYMLQVYYNVTVYINSRFNIIVFYLKEHVLNIFVSMGLRV